MRRAWNLNGGEGYSSSYCPYWLWLYSVIQKINILVEIGMKYKKLNKH
jgi:hypothetical protein